MAPLIHVVAAIIWQDGRFLAARRPPGKPLAGYWEFPGGKLDPGESPAEALVRELDEELGIVPRAPVLWREVFHEYEHASVRLYFFQIHAFDGCLTAREGQDMLWVSPDEAPDLPFLPADQEIVAALALPDNA